MATRQRIVRTRREYNQWVANQTLEDFALRFTAKRARRWSAARVANTALGGISFLALEAIGGTITIGYGFTNAVVAILATSLLILLSAIPISYFAARDGVDIDLLTRGAGFGYIGSTITSLIYASFTFIFFAIETVILASMLESILGVPAWIATCLCSVAIIPLVTHGVTFIGRVQLWTQPLWLALQLLPFVIIAAGAAGAAANWRGYGGASGQFHHFEPLACGAAASVVFSLIAQIGEQADYLRFLPAPAPKPATGRRRAVWWTAMLAGGPGWILIGAAKMLAGSFLATLALSAGLAPAEAIRPADMYRVAFAHATGPHIAVALTFVFVLVSQVKINITNAYAGSIAWSNFFCRLTHSHPGRVVWLIFNIVIALLLMELGIYKAIEHTLALYAIIAASWVGALVADLVVNKSLGWSPAYIEFKRAHLFDVNPVGLGAMLAALGAGFAAFETWLGPTLHAFSPFVAFATAFVAAPLLAWATRGRFYLARKPRASWRQRAAITCVICENEFESEDMAYCPVYAGAICSLCCSLDARCHDGCKPSPRLAATIARPLLARLPAGARTALAGAPGRSLAAFAAIASVTALVFMTIYSATARAVATDHTTVAVAFIKAYVALMPVAGVCAWLLVLSRETRRVAQDESQRQTRLLLAEIEAHRRTDAKLARAKEAAESANLAKTRYVVGISHELRSPLNAVLGYAQLIERDPAIGERRRAQLGIVRRSAEHLAGLIDGLLDIAKIEAGRIELYRDAVRLAEFLDQLVNMFRLQAEAKGIGFVFVLPERLPAIVYTDERRLRQILINLLSNAVKFTASGEVRLIVRWRREIAEFDIEDTGFGIAPADQERIFEPFERIAGAAMAGIQGAGLGLTITRLLTQIMGGELTLHSRPGEGSRFRLKLMLSEAVEGHRLSPAPPSIRGYAGARLSVLVADDDPVHRGLMQDLLTPLGFVVFTAAGAEECIQLAAQSRPDLLLVDVSMPDGTGWEVARRLREGGFPDLPIIVISANASELLSPPGQQRFHDDVLAKPIMLDDLLARIGAPFDLRWESGEQAAQTGAARAGAAAPPVVALPRATIDELRRLGGIGYVRGLLVTLDRIAQEQPDAAPAIERLRALVEECRIDGFMALLDEAGLDEAGLDEAGLDEAGAVSKAGA